MRHKSSWLGIALAGLSLFSGRTHAQHVAAVSVCFPGAFLCISFLSSRAHMTDSLTRACSVCLSLSTSLARLFPRSLPLSPPSPGYAHGLSSLLLYDGMAAVNAAENPNPLGEMGSLMSVVCDVRMYACMYV